MLTLDTLARMGSRMPSEPFGGSGAPPFRQPDAALRVREVHLPTVGEEARRALGLFAFVTTSAICALTVAGLLATHLGAILANDTPDTATLLATAGWYAGWTALFVVPFAALGLGRELLRYRAVRAAVGASAWLDTAGWLRREDGAPLVSLGAGSLGAGSLSAGPRG